MKGGMAERAQGEGEGVWQGDKTENRAAKEK